MLSVARNADRLICSSGCVARTVKVADMSRGRGEGGSDCELRSINRVVCYDQSIE